MISPLGQEFALHRGLGDYLLSAPRDSLIIANKEGIISLPRKKNKESQYFNLNSFPRLSRHSASGALCRHHHSATFPIFFFVNRRCSSTSEEIVIQQPLVVMTPIWISQHPDKQRKQLRNFIHLLLYGGVFWDLFVFSTSMGYGTWGRCFEENGNLWKNSALTIS